MADITHDFPIAASVERVFDAVSTPAGLDEWWTEESRGDPSQGAEYHLKFGPSHIWKAEVTKCKPVSEFELRILDADTDWTGTRVGFQLEDRDELTWIRFYHLGWPETNEHYRISCYCWAMYLRVLKRYLEHNESVPYDQRLDV